MNSHHDIAQRYLAIWNEGDAARRRARIAELWAADARYADPLMAGEGHDGIEAMIAAAQAQFGKQFPGHRFSLVGTPDRHGGNLRFSWSLAPEGGAPVAHGTDFATLDAEGKLTCVTGFLDQPSPGA
jgi:hypothetical protein